LPAAIRRCASFSGSVRGSESLLVTSRYVSSAAIVASSATATAIISRPSSLLPMLNSLTRGEEAASARM
jgi:hypothetical protein